MDDLTYKIIENNRKTILSRTNLKVYLSIIFNDLTYVGPSIRRSFAIKSSIFRSIAYYTYAVCTYLLEFIYDIDKLYNDM